LFFSLHGRRLTKTVNRARPAAGRWTKTGNREQETWKRIVPVGSELNWWLGADGSVVAETCL